MKEGTLTTLLVIFAGTALSPIVANLIPRGLVPAVVLEILFGIAIGPHGADLGATDEVIGCWRPSGLGSLMFLAGYEIDFAEIRGKPLRLASIAWVLSLALALLVGLVLATAGAVVSFLLIGLALTSTALSTILPIVSDAGDLHTDFGALFMAIGSVGEFGPILAIAVLLGTDSPGSTVLLLAAFVLVAGAAARLAVRPRSGWFTQLSSHSLSTSGQLSVRIAVLMLVGLLWLATRLTLDVLLGAFAAGMVFRLFVYSGPEADREKIEGRVKAIGFGFLVPLFFVVTGMRFDVQPFIDRPSVILRMLMFAGLLLVVRGLPALWVYRGEARGDRNALAFLSSTALPIIVVITTIGTETGRMRTDNASALVGAGMLSVLFFPVIAMAQRRKARLEVPEPGPAAG